MTNSALVGRERELQLITDLINHAPERGAALVVRGEAGIGKSSLMAAAARQAREQGMLVLSISAVQTETHLPFAGLQMLLRPIFAGVEHLPAPQRDAVLAAFGMTDAAAPDHFLIALAALDLLAEVATRAPLLLLVEDCQWGDRSTCNVLTFIARRLESEPIVLLFALRDGTDSPLNDLDLPELRLGALDETAAGALLDQRAPGLATEVRRRLLDEAAGNPLALVELHTALAGEQLGGERPLPAWLPLTTRLERAFTTRLADLPAATRTVLLVAAVDDGGNVAEILHASAILLDTPDLSAAVLDPAVAVRLIELEDLTLTFRHPLIRSAVRQVASGAQQRAAHAALADVLIDQPDRCAWHRAAAAIGPDEAVAAGLEAAAIRAHTRGAIAVASRAFERAAILSDNPLRRGARLLRAAEQASELGRRADLQRLLSEAERLDLTEDDRLRLAWLQESIDEGEPGDTATLLAHVDLAARARDAGAPDVALNILLVTAVKCWWSAPEAAVREAILTAAKQLSVSPHDPRLINILALTDPVGHSSVVLERLSAYTPRTLPSARETNLLCGAACAVVDYEVAAPLLEPTIAGLRAEGRLAPLAQALVMRAWATLWLHKSSLAWIDAEEGGKLARETWQPQWVAYAQTIKAVLAGLRGEADVAEAFAAEAEQQMLRSRTSAVLAVVQMARGLTALSAGRYRDAYTQVRRVFDPADVAHHPMVAPTIIGDLAEAAVHAGRRDAARSLLAATEAVAAENSTPRIHMPVRFARALLAENDDAEALYLAALNADLSAWPLDRARLHLAFGMWLRRQRRVAESRPHLSTARDTFDAIGALPWGERARQELRAAGETSRKRTPDLLDLLTPQEIQIAMMAAEGYTNREIGQRLYLSHRTVSTHLYHIFPKLGIASRGELVAALNLDRPIPS